MRIGNSLLSRTAVAAGAIAANKLVGFDNLQASVAGQKVKGVAEFDAASGESVTLTLKGTAFIFAGAAIAAGDRLVADAQGRAVPASALEVDAGAVAVTSSAANGAILVGGEPPEFVFGTALEAASGAGVLFEALLD